MKRDDLTRSCKLTRFRDCRRRGKDEKKESRVDRYCAWLPNNSLAGECGGKIAPSGLKEVGRLSARIPKNTQQRGPR